MSATTTLAPPRLLTRVASAVATETGLVRLGLALIALHVLDDSFLQPEPGVAAGDHLVSGLVPLAVLGLFAWAYPRLRGGARGALALLAGVISVSLGLEAVHYTRTLGPSGDDFTGLLALPAALLVAGTGAVTLWRTRRVDGNRPWRYARRALLAVAGGFVATTVVVPIGAAYVTTHTARAVVPANHLGAPYEDVRFTTADGLELRGWYIPSRNGAAVIAFAGRHGTQAPARMLARHGYGVLLFDRRGEGESEGRPNAYGWGGDADVKAAIAFLQRRPDVDRARIGGIGFSVGGELMLETAAETDGLAAVVSEGAGFRTFSEEQDSAAASGAQGALYLAGAAVRTASVAVFSGQRPPADLEDLVGRIAPRPLMLIAAPNSKHGEELNRRYHAAAGATSTLWEIPESRHVGGQAARPAEYERRVVGFFDAALGR